MGKIQKNIFCEALELQEYEFLIRKQLLLSKKKIIIKILIILRKCLENGKRFA
jgi:hypothetical protein